LTDFMFFPISILLSSLIRQVENGIDSVQEGDNETGTEDAGTGLGTGPMEVDPYEPIVQLIKIGIAAFSLLLLGLSITAYKRTALKAIMYAAIAFGLFAAQLLFDYMEDAIEGLEQPYNDVIYYAMTLAILVFFFLAIVRRK
jgi:hypothetical protein